MGDSIQEAAVRMQFQVQLPPHLVELMREGVLEAHEEAFPRSREVHGGEIKIDVSDPSSIQSMGCQTCWLRIVQAASKRRIG